MAQGNAERDGFFEEESYVQFGEACQQLENLEE